MKKIQSKFENARTINNLIELKSAELLDDLEKLIHKKTANQEINTKKEISEASRQQT